MYSRLRVDKQHPDGSPRAAWEAYRLADHDGAVRLWAPPFTPRIHVNGRWAPVSPVLTTWTPGDPFVIAAWEEADATELYVDIVRQATITPTNFSYVDLYVDVMLRGDRVWSKDEEKLVNLTADEAARVLTIRDRLLDHMRAGAAPFRLDDPRWHVAPEARALAPGVDLAL
jgi:hypothetical protein